MKLCRLMRTSDTGQRWANIQQSSGERNAAGQCHSDWARHASGTTGGIQVDYRPPNQTTRCPPAVMQLLFPAQIGQLLGRKKRLFPSLYDIRSRHNKCWSLLKEIAAWSLILWDELDQGTYWSVTLIRKIWKVCNSNLAQLKISAFYKSLVWSSVCFVTILNVATYFTLLTRVYLTYAVIKGPYNSTCCLTQVSQFIFLTHPSCFQTISDRADLWKVRTCSLNSHAELKSTKRY